VVFLDDRLQPWRWVAPGVALMLLMVIYPVAYTVVIAFTNYGDGHLLSKAQAIAQFESTYYDPPDAVRYAWTAYASPVGDAFLFRLVAEDGGVFIAQAGAPGLRRIEMIAQESPGATGPPDDDGLPRTILGYRRLARNEAVRFIAALQAQVIADPPYVVRITSLNEASQQARRYAYDPATDTLTDRSDGRVYVARDGRFVLLAARDGDGEITALSPGFASGVGLSNFLRVLTDERVREPFARVFAWTFAFAGISVASTFALGTALALTLNARDLPLRGFFRAAMIVPYAVPGFISILVWTGLLNPIYGPINNAIAGLTGVSPRWFSDPTLAKIAVLLINLWLGFPYMMLVVLGTLQSISPDIYEAAVIDGASPQQNFWHITLPLLLIAVAPLLVASFALNFNNFTVIDLFNEGGPPIGGGSVAGHTDILISYTYRLAFSGGRGTDYGFASAIAVLIFFIIGALTAFNFRLTGRLEQVSEHV
jgi:ABC-type sugar transport system permease subunit